MIRRIIEIDEDKCNGCGLCADACHEDAIGIVDGKAKLLRDDYCDGLGDCLPNCPTGAISFVEREAAAYDREAVEANMKKKAEMTAKNKIEEKETKKNECAEMKLFEYPTQIPDINAQSEGLKMICADRTAKYWQAKENVIRCSPMVIEII